MSDRPVIEARGLQKRYGEHLAVAGVDLEVPAGSILGVLGPNGAGKSTTIRMLTTMTRPDGGTATVGGLDVVTEADRVRRIIGVTGQDATLDELLSGTQNLVLIGQLAKLSRREARARARDLLERFELTDAAERMVKTYSGGMRRRLDLAASLMTRPPVLFLDEPTTGLDPTSRMRMWAVIRELVADGTTLLLTTQYLDEADALADRISVIDHGRVIAEGTARELKARIGGETLEVALAAPSVGVAEALAPLVDGQVLLLDEGRRVRAPIAPRPGLATAVIRALDDIGVAVDDIAVQHPSLDDVFFALTGHPTDGPDDPSIDPANDGDHPDPVHRADPARRPAPADDAELVEA
jgi:daunorubicin resistance ABC transporter ATP-binding subunit